MALIGISIFSFSSFATEYPFLKEYKGLISKKYILIPHRGTYLLPFIYNDNPNNKVYETAFPDVVKEKRGNFNDYTEAEFQISFLILTNKNIFNSGFDTFIGYTHQSWWQVYNTDWSRPFRETNYAPEVFFRKVPDDPVSFFLGKILVYDFGFIHQSNGQIQELSRSWNRFFYRVVLVFDQIMLKTTLWHRLPEETNEDENPRIYNYLGYGELEIKHKFNSHSYQLRIIPGIKKQGFEFSINTPWKEGLQFYTRVGYGYGLSLLDYDHDNRKIGMGFILADPFTK